MKSIYFKIFVCTSVCVLLGIASGFSTLESIDNWYKYISKPSWNPPNWLFGPVWTVLYFLMGFALALIWHADKPGKKSAEGLFIIQFALNLTWSFIFFNMHLPGWAFAEIVVMLLFIILTVISFYRINKTAAYLLVPYLLWVSFATVLNGTIWYLNK